MIGALIEFLGTLAVMLLYFAMCGVLLIATQAIIYWITGFSIWNFFKNF